MLARIELLEKKTLEQLMAMKFSDMGFSCFGGLEANSIMTLAQADYANGTLQNVIDINIPFNGLLVISDHMPHGVDVFHGDHLHAPTNKRDPQNRDFHLKSFLSINDFHASINNDQGWFHPDGKFLQNTPP